ncbi:hypothetical protein K492DRAFT_188689 [Lichtheimia hyalospora FSU 10163]|nr:hypothetical protein K492DRAFT_188689 [Lichtheimia hyalospora FSU 10163]
MVRLFTLTTAILGLFLTAESVTAGPTREPPTTSGGGGGGDDNTLKSFLDVANTFCGVVNGHPDDLSKVVASAENTVGGGSGPGNGSPINPGQYVFKLAKQFCDHVKQQPQEPSSSQLGEGSATIP